jgi:hypothetical protein
VVEVATAVVVDVASPSPAVVDVIDVEDGADEVDVDDEVAPAALMVGFPPQLVAKPATTTTAIRAGTRRLDKDGDIVVVSAHCDGLLRGAATTFRPNPAQPCRPALKVRWVPTKDLHDRRIASVKDPAPRATRRRRCGNRMNQARPAMMAHKGRALT